MDIKLGDAINGIAAKAYLLNNKLNDTQIIEGFAEIEVNGTVYQVQIVLEPNKSNWAKEDECVIRKTII